MAEISVGSGSPFTPGYGKQPLVFGGHHEVVAELTSVFETYDFGENHSILISGLRGAGKTSMLGVLRDAAKSHGWFVVSDNAGAGLVDRVSRSTMPQLLESLTGSERTRLTGLQLAQLGLQWTTERTGPEPKPLLRHQLAALAAARDNGGILITVDEVSSGKTRLRELGRFALELQHALEEGLNIMVAFAGVKIDLDELVKQQHLTFLRRSREVDFRLLAPSETRDVFAQTVGLGGRAIDDDALDLLVRVAQGYPYLIQLAGDYAWRHNVTAPQISLADAKDAHQRAIKAVTSRVISRVWDDLSEQDQTFLRALAGGGGRRKMAEIADRMGRSSQYVNIYKQRLVDSGYVQPDGRGYVAFSLPYLDQYISSLGQGDATDDDVQPASGDTWNDYPPPEL
ncbi:ATP-binding protein [Microcella alkaliphila]|uniref:Orc1-like AAA ATPase domain-containing protein n=1 Tax=Microcella alkaliphila TaxID=279828 RepID=A0A0U4NYL5_9MICO|nr:ATP-binding protein [Microcella alkaliphila]BAU33299.1 uncharacterized protein MalAC0309_2459 [Microcella alkaliphila]